MNDENVKYDSQKKRALNLQFPLQSFSFPGMKKLWELKGSKTYIQYEVQFTSGRGRLRCAFSGLPASTSPANQSTDIVVPAICNNFASNWSYSAVPIYWICKVLSPCGGLNELKGLIPLLCGEPLGVIRTRTSSLHLMSYLPKKKEKKKDPLTTKCILLALWNSVSGNQLYLPGNQAGATHDFPESTVGLHGQSRGWSGRWQHTLATLGAASSLLQNCCVR